MTFVLLMMATISQAANSANPYDTIYVSDYSDIQKYVTYYDIKKIEGCTFSFIVPSDISGPTIGTGLDIGNMGIKNINAIFSGIVSDSILKVLLTAHRRVGDRARLWIAANNIRISEAQARRLANRLLKHYWKPIKESYPCMDTAKSAAKHGVLSYAIHVGNLARITPYLKTCNYNSIANIIEADERNPQRRYVEASLIRAQKNILQ